VKLFKKFNLIPILNWNPWNYLCYLFLKFYFINFAFTFMYTLHVYIIWSTYPLPLSCLQEEPILPCCSPIMLKKKTYRIKRKRAFLLLWGGDSYTERFLVLFPCICVLQLKLVHLYQTSSLLPSSLPIAASASLRLLHSLLHSEHISYIQVFYFFSFPYPSHVQSPLSVWPVSNNTTQSILGL
jgi:hypothetical protein